MDQLKERIQNPEFMGTIFVTFGSLLGSFFSYLLQFYLGRTLTVSDFGTFTALLSLTYIFSVPSGVFGTSLIKKVADLAGQKSVKALSRLFKGLTFYSIVFMIITFVLMTLLRKNISDFLNIQDSLVIYGFAFLMSLSFLGALPSSYLQGTLRYKAFSIYIAVASFMRLFFPVVLVTLGYGVFGAYFGMALAVLFSFIIAMIPIKKFFTADATEFVESHYKDLLTFGLPVLFVNLGMILLSNIDLLFVKSVFDPVTAGYYAGTVTLGKILLFGAGTVTVIMFPKIASLHDKLQIVNSFKFFFKIQVLFALCGVVAFSIFPKLVTMIFFGERFIHSVTYLTLFSIFIGLYVLVNFMIMFFLATNHTEVSAFLVGGVILQVVLLLAFHGSIFQIIYVDIVVAFLLLVALMYKYHRFSR